MKLLFLLVLATLFNPTSVFAQDPVPTAGLNLDDLTKTALPRWPSTPTIGNLIVDLLPYVFGIAGFLILIFIILGGFQILTSQNDPKALAAGQQKITYAIVGFIVAFSAFWIVQLLARILDLPPIIDIFR